MNATVFGRIGKDATLTEGKFTIAKFGVALSFYQKGSDRGTQWVNVSLFGTRAEKLAPYLTAGSSVAVTGDLKVRTYEKSDGETGISLDMNAESIALLGGGGGGRGDEDESPTPADSEASF
jgi:single-strand DNA-binding protein